MNSISGDCYFVDPGQEVEIELLRPEDAEGVALLFSSIYGEVYPDWTCNIPAQLISRHSEGSMISSVARTRNGDIVGYAALMRSDTFERLYESGQAQILLSYRMRGLNRRLFEHLFTEGPKRYNIDAIFGEALCNRIFMQRTAVRLGHQETAFQVDSMPSLVFRGEKRAEGRISSLFMFSEITGRVQNVYLPDEYREAIAMIYGRIKLRRTLAPAEGSPPPDKETVSDIRQLDYAGLVRVFIREAGSDFEKFVQIMESRHLLNGIKVVQFYLNLADPWVGEAVDILRSKRYFFGGVIPRWFDEDALLMQKVVDHPNWERINLYSDWARRIMKIVRDDWATTMNSM